MTQTPLIVKSLLDPSSIEEGGTTPADAAVPTTKGPGAPSEGSAASSLFHSGRTHCGAAGFRRDREPEPPEDGMPMIL